MHTNTHTHYLLSPYNGTEFTWFWCLSHCIGYLIGRLFLKEECWCSSVSCCSFSGVESLRAFFFIDISISICIILVQVLFKRQGYLHFTDEAFLTHSRHSLTENLLFFWLLPSPSSLMSLEHQVKSCAVHVAVGMRTPRPHVPKRFISLFWQVA